MRDVPVADAAEAEDASIDTEGRSAGLVPPSDVEPDVVVSAVSPAPVTGEESVAPVAATDVPVIVIPTTEPVQEVVSEPEPEAPAPPAATEEPPPDSGSEFRWHTVSAGETLAGIAYRYNTTVNAIAQANGIANPNVIIPGQRLRIPKAGSSGGSSSSGCRYRHTVQSGEWIWQLGRVYGVSGSAILRANGLTIESGSNIQPGTVLCIP